MRILLTARASVAVALAGLAPAWAYGPHPVPPADRHARAQNPKANNEKGPKLLGPAPVEQLRHMSPEERQRFLDSLSPARRQRLQERLDQYEQIPPAQRLRLEKTYEKFQQLPPEQQELMRQGFRGFSRLSPDRRQALREEMRNLRLLSPGERRKRENSRAFRHRYSADERQIMDQMTQMAPNK